MHNKRAKLRSVTEHTAEGLVVALDNIVLDEGNNYATHGEGVIRGFMFQTSRMKNIF